MKRQPPEKVSIYKGFRAFEKSRSESRLHAPKLRALPTAPHPDFYSIFHCFCVEVGQTVVKSKIYTVLHFLKVPKTRINKGVFALLIFRSGESYARSQTSRANNCATPRKKIFNYTQSVVRLRFLLQLRLCLRAQAYLPIAKLLPLKTAYFIRHRRRAPFFPNCATSRKKIFNYMQAVVRLTTKSSVFEGFIKCVLGYCLYKPGSVVGNHLSCFGVTAKFCAASLLIYGRGSRAFLLFAGRCFG